MIQNNGNQTWPKDKTKLIFDRKYLNGKYSEKFIKLILCMLEVDENKRMDFIELEKFVLDLGFEE